MKKTRSLNAVTFLVLSGCYTLCFVFYMFLENFNHLVFTWGKDLQMMVYLKENSSPDEIDKLQKLIQQEKGVVEIKARSSEQNFQQFKEQLGTLWPQLERESEIKALIPTTLQIFFDFKEHLSNPTALFKSVAEKLKTFVAVEQVSYGQIWLEKFSGLFDLIQKASVLAALTFLCAVVFVFSNIIRVWVQARRTEIEVLELIGATTWKIRRPFLFRGTMLGAFSGLVAVLLTAAIFYYLKNALMSSQVLSNWGSLIRNINGTEAFGFVLFSAVLGLVSAYLCVREINTGWALVEDLG